MRRTVTELPLYPAQNKHFTDLGFFCFEVFCSLVQDVGLFKKFILEPSVSQASCQSQGY